jgi:uncharacterized protein (TIGR03083 family)
LLEVLRGLAPEAWALPTACTGWSVKDLAAHLLGGNIGRLSFQRDKIQKAGPTSPIETTAELIAWIDARNQAWVEVARGISPALLVDFLEITDKQLYEFFNSLPLEARSGVPVAWAGEAASTNWFDIGREYTEKWFHQQQIREAVGVDGIVERKWLYPVMEICVRALPYTYRLTDAPEGTTLTLEVSGEAGSMWTLSRHDRGWQLFEGGSDAPATRIQLSDDSAWRLFSKGLGEEALRERISIEGDIALGEVVYDLIAIMA